MGSLFGYPTETFIYNPQYEDLEYLSKSNKFMGCVEILGTHSIDLTINLYMELANRLVEQVYVLSVNNCKVSQYNIMDLILTFIEEWFKTNDPEVSLKHIYFIEPSIKIFPDSSGYTAKIELYESLI